MFKMICSVIAPWLFASFAFYVFGASLTSFAELDNNFDITEWSDAGRAIYFIFSCGALVASAVSFYMEVEVKNV